VVIKGSFYEHRETDGSGEIYFNMLNKQLVKNFPEARMVTAVFVAFNLKEMYADFVIAGHPHPFIVEKNEIIQPRTRNPVLGFLDDVNYIRERISITPGMRIFMYTDGIINVQKYNENGISHLGKQGLSHSIKDHNHEALLNMVEDIWTDTMLFCDQKPCDDMLLLGIEVPKNGTMNNSDYPKISFVEE
jgi:sigma-B regulation protein RsbU (phosphoserine phosphatase)